MLKEIVPYHSMVTFYQHQRHLVSSLSESKSIVLAGLAKLIAGATSMGISGFLASLLNTELLERSEGRSMLDIDVGGAEFSRSDILQRNLKGLGFNLLCVALHFNGLVVPDFRCRRWSWR